MIHLIYAIADTHLDGGQDKPMDVFSDIWLNHKDNIEKKLEGDCH